MTDTVGDSRPSRRFDAVVVRRLFDGLSSHLRAAGSHNHNLMIVGGAALALLWEDRLTRDVDVLEHRFRWRHDSPAERHTGAVDFISMRIPEEMDSAARLVAEAENLPWNWLNGAAAIFTPECDLEPQVLYRSDCLVVSAPSRRVMLAMKLHAGREVDLEDAARLATETATTDAAQLQALLEHAYGPDAVTPDTASFAERALTLDQQALPHERPWAGRPSWEAHDRGLGI